MGQMGLAAAGPTAADPSAGAADRDGTAAASRPALVFRAGTLLCALPLAEIIETMRPLPVHRVAGVPPYLSGLTIMRGRPTPVVDIALLLTGTSAPAARFVAVRAGRRPVAVATGPVVDVRRRLPVADPDGAALDPGTARLVAGVGAAAGEPLFLLRGARLVPDEVWAAIAVGDVAVGDTDGGPAAAP